MFFEHLLRPDGKRYVGEWLEGKQHGRGVMEDPKGQRREGEWSNGVHVRWIGKGVDKVNESSQ